MTQTIKAASDRTPSFGEAVRFWLKLGFISFGGPTGQIAIMHAEVVDRRKWIDDDHFLHALNYCMLLPGPEAQQLAIYLGWLLHGTWGGVVAGVLFILPSLFVLLALSWVYVVLGTQPAIAALFYGLKAAVLAIVAAALIRIAQRALKNGLLVTLAVLAFVALYAFHVPFPAVILGAAAVGIVGSRLRPELFATGAAHGTPSSRPSHAGRPRPAAHTWRVVATCLTLWSIPLMSLVWWRGVADVFVRQAVFFTKAAMVTFGGAYAVLPYIAQAGVETYGWLQPGQMIDGLGLAETTPGPLIMVVAFVAYLGAWTHAQGLSPAVAGAIGGVVATYFTFLPSFLWILAGAPYVERTRGDLRVTAPLSAITAAVVGVVLNLAVYFAEHVVFPTAGQLDAVALSIAVIAFIALRRFNANVVAVICGGAAAGLVYRWGLGG